MDMALFEEAPCALETVFGVGETLEPGPRSAIPPGYSLDHEIAYALWGGGTLLVPTFRSRWDAEGNRVQIKRWTKAEDDKLRECAARFVRQELICENGDLRWSQATHSDGTAAAINWEIVAFYLGTRDTHACKMRWYYLQRKSRRTPAPPKTTEGDRWASTEIDRLRNFLSGVPETDGAEKYIARIQAMFPKRAREDCLSRASALLARLRAREGVKRRKTESNQARSWEPEEDSKLKEMYECFGSVWTLYLPHFADRSAESIRMRYRRLLDQSKSLHAASGERS